MPRFVLALLALTLLSTPAGAETCGDIPRPDGPPVYVILYGFPDAPNTKLQRLKMVDRDLVHMAQFFSALAPEQMYILGEPNPELLRRGDVHRPSWRSLLTIVESIVDAIDAADAEMLPDVYIYLAGHGIQSGGPEGDGGGRLVVFGHAERGATESGYDGRIHSALIARHILAPLAERARVHLIADTCHSHHLLETRKIRRSERVLTAAPKREYATNFTANFPGVGAHLATRTVTPENDLHGGLFSHAIRSMAIGVADFDRDGVLTYGEMGVALNQLAVSMAALREPIIVAPGLDRDVPFIDWRGSPEAARVCVPTVLSGRRVLSAGGKAFATIRTPGPEGPLWLPKGHTFRLGTGRWIGPWHHFIAADGMLHVAEE